MVEVTPIFCDAANLIIVKNSTGALHPIPTTDSQNNCKLNPDAQSWARASNENYNKNQYRTELLLGRVKCEEFRQYYSLVVQPATLTCSPTCNPYLQPL